MIHPYDDDKPRDECGIFGIYGDPDVAYLTYLGLYSLQHRGQESAGIVTSDREKLHGYHGMGLVINVFNEEKLAMLEGDMAIGHNRYSTAGSSDLKNAQPIVRNISGEPLAIAHNGNIVNAMQIRRQLESEGAIFTSNSDTEIVAHLIARSNQPSMEDRILDALSQMRGAYSILFMTRDKMIAARDPMGFRPLWMGTLGDAIVFASESCALDVIEAKPDREIDPGEMVIVAPNGVRSIRYAFERHAFCIFEYIYLSRPDSVVFGEIVNAPRRRFGMQLAVEHPADADIVIPVPDSATIATLGYAQKSGIPFEFGFHRNQYVGRTFIQPTQTSREKMVNIKLNAIRDVVDGKRVVVVDDSIVRGTSSRRIVKILRRGGAREVHFRISSPPNKFPCFYGIDTPTRQELIASSHAVEEIRKYIRADSLGYLSIEGMLSCVSDPDRFCKACFDGDYPVKFTGQSMQQLSLDFSKDRKR